MRTINPYHYGTIEQSEVNQLAQENYFSLIEQSENFYRQQLSQVADQVDAQSRESQVLCLSGPSASGKTTTAHNLARLFQSRGRACRVISLDDFYLDRSRSPRRPDGQFDFETIYSLDIELIQHCIQELTQQGHTRTPVFDFQTKQRSEHWNDVLLQPGEIVILEGLHGLNPMLTDLAGEDKVTKIYVSARSKFVDGERAIFSPKDIRLMRRMVRDTISRNTPPEETVAMWQLVCEGEREYINPFRDLARFKLDTTMGYEPNIFHVFLAPILDRPRMDQEAFRQIDSLYQRLDEFFDINDISPIPQNSVIREFIGFPEAAPKAAPEEDTPCPRP